MWALLFRVIEDSLEVAFWNTVELLSSLIAALARMSRLTLALLDSVTDP
jgi:hypothetical protein